MKAKRPERKKRKRIGFGESSGHGKTSTKGHKGQRARAGFHMRPGFEGGQTPLYRKVPKRGFNQPHHRSFAILNLDQINELGVPEITPEWLLQHEVVKDLGGGLKILGRGKLSQKVTIRAHKFSAQAKQAIEQAGGQAVVIMERGVSNKSTVTE